MFTTIWTNVCNILGRELRVELRLQGSQPSVLPLHYSQHLLSMRSFTSTSLDSQSSVQLRQLLAASVWLTLFESNEAHQSQSLGRKPLRQASIVCFSYCLIA